MLHLAVTGCEIQVEITARMRRFPVDHHAEVGALSFNFRIEKRQLPVFFNLHSELNCGILLVEVVQSCLQCVTFHDSESVIDEAKPQSWTIGHGGDGVALQVLHEGPLRIDVTVTAKWPLWVLRNVTPFTASHFRQSSEQIFLVLVFVFLKTVFWNLFPMRRKQHI